MTVILPFGRLVARQALPKSNHLLTRLASSNSLLRVSCNESEHTQSCSGYITRNGMVLVARGYATDAAARVPAKAPAKPKAHTGRVTAKKSTTKPKSSTATKKTTTKKPAKKPVKKVKKTIKAKAKPKTKPRTKKVPSKTAVNRARLAKDKDLKAKALLTEPKRLPTTAWALFFTRNRAGIKNITEGAEKTKEISRNYRQLPAEDREQLNHTANQNRKQNENEYKKWVAQFTPAEVKEANHARKEISQRKKVKEGKRKAPIHLIKDDRVVKGQRNAYSFFATDRWASGDFKHMTLPESSGLIGREWKALSASDKKPFEDQAQADHNRYIEEYKTVYGKDPPSVEAKKST